MIELLLEPVIELIAFVVRAIVLVFVWFPFAAIAGIMARDISPDAFMWQATARVASILLIVILMAVATWPGIGSTTVWWFCLGLGIVVFACGYIAEYRNVRRTGEEPVSFGAPKPAVDGGRKRPMSWRNPRYDRSQAQRLGNAYRQAATTKPATIAATPRASMARRMASMISLNEFMSSRRGGPVGILG